MIPNPKLLRTTIGSALLGPALHGEALPQSYPSKPLRMIVPFTPVDAADVLASIVGDDLSKRLAQSVVIDKKPGAGGTIGAQGAAAAPDSYKLLVPACVAGGVPL